MDVTVDQTGTDHLAPDIDLLFPFIFTDADDIAVFYGNVSRFDIIGKYVHDPCVLQHEVRHEVASCSKDHLFDLFIGKHVVCIHNNSMAAVYLSLL